MDCQRDSGRKSRVNSGKRTKARPRSTQAVPGGERISLQAAIGHVVFDHEKVSSAARRAGKAKKSVSEGAWEYVKRVVRSRDNSRCQKCQKNLKTPDVHHRKPKQMGGSDSGTTYGLANLVSLCRNCHSWAHENPIAAMDLGLLLSQSVEPEEEPVLVRGRERWFTYLGGVEHGRKEATDGSSNSA